MLKRCPLAASMTVMAVTNCAFAPVLSMRCRTSRHESPTDRPGCENTSINNSESPMIRKTIFAVATVAAIGATALIPTEASAGGGGKGGGHHGHWGHGHWGRHFGIVVIGPSCWRWIPGLGKVYVCY